MSKYLYIDPKTIVTRKRFVDAFRMDKQDLENICASIRLNDWDKDQPVILALLKGESVPFCVDGHTRKTGAIIENVSRITYIIKEFETEDDAFAYVQSLQFNRRNLSDKDKIMLIQNHTGYEHAKNKKLFISQLLHISERSAAKYMTILKDPERLQLVIEDKETINSSQVVKADDQKSRIDEIRKKIEKLDQSEIAELEKIIKELKRRK